MTNSLSNQPLWSQIIASETHAVVEASAGTGKTYTILQYILELLSAKRVHLEDILLVTFTDKATGELKDRIRSGILEEIQRLKKINSTDASLLAHLEYNLAKVDQAPISTIHGFCLRTLQGLAYDAGLPIQTQLVDDKEGLQRTWRSYLRSSWVRQDLLPVLKADHPDQAENLAEEADEFARLIFHFCGDLSNQILKFAKVWARPDLSQKENFWDLYLELKKEYEKSLLPSTKKTPPKINKKPIAGLFAQMIYRRYQTEKILAGQISFDDMIRLLAERLASGNEALISNLRQKYSYGIVDEFQDTDDAQWGIFKKIFLESPMQGNKPENILLVVGDPKQAIYGFRGADLGTYFSAKTAIMAKTKLPAYFLKKNYRSTPQMIEAYNYLFNLGRNSNEVATLEDPFWFRNENIQYFTEDEVGAGKENFVSSIALSPADLAQPFVLLDLKHLEKAPEQYKCYADWTVQKIVDLMKQSQQLVKANAKGRALSLNDIAILARSKAGMIPFQNALDQAQIPWDIYKEAGLYQSDECYHWIVTLEALKNQGAEIKSLRKMLLSPFGGVPLEVLESSSEDLQDHLSKTREKLRLWGDYVTKRDWSKLVRHINQETPYFQWAMKQIHGDRILSNLQQIQTQCLIWWIEENLSLDDVILRLYEYKNNPEDVAENESLFQIAHEKPKVRLMTMHTAKGLEFPIVFNMMARSLSDRSEYYLDRDHNVIYFDKDLGGVKSKSQQANLEEYARILYVSYTRASLIQFAPLYSDGLKSEKTKTKPPVEIFRDNNTFARPLDRLAQDKPELCRLETYRAQKVGVLEFHDDGDLIKQDLSILDERLKSISTHSKPIDQYSFTKISPHSDAHAQTARDFDEVEKEVVEEVDVLHAEVGGGESTEIKSNLPPGKNTGLFWHELFEKMDWQVLLGESIENLATEVQENESPEIIKLKKLLHHTQNKFGLSAKTNTEDLGLKRRTETLAMMQKVLQTAIPDPYYLAEMGFGVIPKIYPAQTFTLGEILPQDRKAEMDFLCPVDTKGNAFPREKTDVAGYLTGSLDLVFKHEGRYYILDWKSNFLKEGYDQNQVHDAVLHSHYHLQASIYAMALDRWLSEVQVGYDREKHFGGVIYAFVRGMGSKVDGLWIRRPSDEDWATGFKYSLGENDMQSRLQKHLPELMEKS